MFINIHINMIYFTKMVKNVYFSLYLTNSFIKFKTLENINKNRT